jgi:hypothetical protein
MAIKQPTASIIYAIQNGTDEHTSWNVAGVICDTTTANISNGINGTIIGSVNINKVLTKGLRFFIFSWFKVKILFVT